MKVIDLLNKIANNEEVPKKIKYQGDIYLYNEDENVYEGLEECVTLLENVYECDLNDEIEIIEEEKDKEINYVSTYVLCDIDFERKGKYSLKAVEIIDKAFEEYSETINNLIDELNKIKKEGK